MKYKILPIIILSLFLTSCNLFDFLHDKENQDSKDENEKRIEYVKNIHTIMNEMLSESDELDQSQILSVIDEINKLPEVENTILNDNNVLIVSMNWGTSIIFILNPFPDWNYNENFIDDKNSISEHIIKSNYLLARGYEVTSENSNQKKVAFGIGPEMNWKEYTDQIVTLAQKYSENGFKVDIYAGINFNKDFFLNKVNEYDISIILAHGTYDNKNHIISYNGNAWDAFCSWNSMDIVLPGQINIPDEEKKYKSYPAVAEYEWPKSEFKENSVVLLISCEQMKGNDKLWQLLQKKNLGALLAFDGKADINAGIKMAGDFSDYIFRGHTIEEAYRLMPTKSGRGYASPTDQKNNKLTTYNLLFNTSNPDIKFIDKIPENRKLEVSLVWNFFGDIDLHCLAPKGHLYWDNARIADAYLDRDNTEGGAASVENMYWKEAGDGTYTFVLHYYQPSTKNDITGRGTCKVTIRYGNEKKEYSVYMSSVDQQALVTSITIEQGELRETRSLGVPENLLYNLPKKSMIRH